MRPFGGSHDERGPAGLDGARAPVHPEVVVGADAAAGLGPPGLRQQELQVAVDRALLEGGRFFLGQELAVSVPFGALQRGDGAEVPHALQVRGAPRRARSVLGRRRRGQPRGRDDHGEDAERHDLSLLHFRPPWSGRSLRRRKDSDRYEVDNCTRARPVFYRFGGLARGKVIPATVLSRYRRRQSITCASAAVRSNPAPDKRNPRRRAGQRPDTGSRERTARHPPRRAGQRPDTGCRERTARHPPRRAGQRPDTGCRERTARHSPASSGSTPDTGRRDRTARHLPASIGATSHRSGAAGRARATYSLVMSSQPTVATMYCRPSTL